MPQSLDPSPAEEPTPTPAPTPAQRPSLVKHASLQPIHDDVVPEPLPPRPVAPQQPAPDSPEPTAPAAQPAPAPEETPAAPSTPAQQPAAETTPPVVEPTAASTAPPTIETQPIAQPTAATAPVATPSPAAPFPTPPPRPNSVPTANSSVNEGLTEYEKRQTKKLTMWIIIIGAVYLLMGVLTLVISALFMRGSLLGPATLIYTLPALLIQRCIRHNRHPANTPQRIWSQRRLIPELSIAYRHCYRDHTILHKSPNGSICFRMVRQKPTRAHHASDNSGRNSLRTHKLSPAQAC